MVFKCLPRRSPSPLPIKKAKKDEVESDVTVSDDEDRVSYRDVLTGNRSSRSATPLSVNGRDRFLFPYIC
jgi:hypothetical protein